VEEVVMFARAILMKRVAGPLHRDGLVGSGTDVEGQGRHDGLEVEEVKGEL